MRVLTDLKSPLFSCVVFCCLAWVGTSEAQDAAIVKDRVEIKGAIADRTQVENARELILDEIADADLEQLAGLRELRSLTIRSSKISAPAYALLRLVPELRSLEIRNTFVGNNGMKQIAQIRTIRRLVLVQAGLWDEAMSQFPRMRSLEDLAIGGDCSDPIQARGFAYLAELPNLRRLDLREWWYYRIDAERLAEIRKMKSLRWLSMPVQYDIAPADLAGLCDLRELEGLELIFLAIDADRVNALRGLVPAGKLTLGVREPSAAALGAMKELDRLTALSLADGSFTEATMEGVAQLKGLKSLDLSRTGTIGREIAPLAQIAGLEELDLSETTLTGAGVEMLKTLRQVRRVELRGAKVGKGAVAELRKALPGAVIGGGGSRQ